MGDMTIDETLDKTNWALLARQKQSLVEVLNGALLAPRMEHLEGILNWIDALQEAAENDGRPVVFLTTGG